VAFELLNGLPVWGTYVSPWLADAPPYDNITGAKRKKKKKTVVVQRGYSVSILPNAIGRGQERGNSNLKWL